MQRRWKSRQILNNRADEANESAARSRRISLLLYSPITTATLNFYVALKCLSRAINYSHGLARIYMRRWGWPYFKNLLNIVVMVQILPLRSVLAALCSYAPLLSTCYAHLTSSCFVM